MVVSFPHHSQCICERLGEAPHAPVCVGQCHFSSQPNPVEPYNTSATTVLSNSNRIVAFVVSSGFGIAYGTVASSIVSYLVRSLASSSGGFDTRHWVVRVVVGCPGTGRKDVMSCQFLCLVE